MTTEIGQHWISLEFVMENLHRSQRNLHLLDQKQQSRKLMAKLTAVQRSAITEQFRVQAENVTILKANVTSLSASLQQLLGQAKVASLSGRAKQLLVQADEGPDLELPGYEGIQELFEEEAAVQGSVISKQLPVQADEGPDLELPEYEDIPDMSPEEMIEEYLKSRTDEENEKDEENGMTPEDMLDAYLDSVEVREEEDFDISSEDMKEAAMVEGERRAEFFKLPENQGRQGQVPAELRYLTSMEIWDKESNLSR